MACGFYTHLFMFLLGYLAFPTSLYLAYQYLLAYGGTPIGDELDRVPKVSLEEEEHLAKIQATTLHANSSTKVTMSGWLSVRRQFKPASTGLGIFSAGGSTAGAGPTMDTNGIEPITVAAGDGDSNTSGQEGLNHSRSLNSSTSSNLSNTSTLVNNPTNNAPAPVPNPSTYTARFAQTYRQVMDRQTRRTEPVRENYFCRLKGSVLFMYENETSEEALMAITVEKYGVGMEKGNGAGRWTGKDAEMFSKKNGIALRLAREGVEGMTAVGEGTREREFEGQPWFLFCKITTKTEDWYLALLQVSAAREQTTSTAVFSQTDMKALIDVIDAEPDVLPMRWANAFFGRIFLGLCQTEALEQFIIGKIMKKVLKAAVPGVFSPIIIREVNVGRCPPVFSKPMLKDLTMTGTASAEAYFCYRSRPAQPDSVFRITISTTVTFSLGAGLGFNKPISIPIVLAVLVKSLEGNMRFESKGPPSNRIWYAFTSMPKMDIEIVPVISDQKFQIGWVLKFFDKFLRNGIADTIVMPNMDDLAYFDTSDLPIRGGIFDHAGKHASTVDKDMTTTGIPQEVSMPEGVVAFSALDDQGEFSRLRRRNVSKSQSVDLAGSALQGVVNDLKLASTPATERSSSADRVSDGGPSEPRTEAAIPAFEVPAKKLSMIPNFKWVGTGSAKGPGMGSRESSTSESAGTPSGSSDVVTSAVTDAGTEATTQARTASIEARPITNAIPRPLGTLPPHNPPINQTIRPTVEIPAVPTVSQTATQASPSSIASTSTQANPTQPDPSASTTSSRASLISSFRTGDRKAMVSQVATAKDTFKKWGTNFASKQREKVASLSEEISGSSRSNPNAVYRPDDSTGSGRDDGPHSPRTLKERLDIAAREAAGTSELGRARSGSGSASIGSKAHLSSSPSISQQASSPPKWNISATRPTTSLHRDEASSSRIPVVPVHGFKQEGAGVDGRRGSNGQLVNMQPSAGRSMVVPRVIKRPGEVTGIGSTSDGQIRRVSSDKEEKKGKEVQVNGLGINGIGGVRSTGDVDTIPLPSSSITKLTDSLIPSPSATQLADANGLDQHAGAPVRDGAEEDQGTPLGSLPDLMPAEARGAEKSSHSGRDLVNLAVPEALVDRDSPLEGAPQEMGMEGGEVGYPVPPVQNDAGSTSEADIAPLSFKGGAMGISAVKQNVPPPHQRSVSMSAEDALRRVAKKDEAAVKATGTSTPTSTPSAVMEESS